MTLHRALALPLACAAISAAWAQPSYTVQRILQADGIGLAGTCLSETGIVGGQFEKDFHTNVFRWNAGHVDYLYGLWDDSLAYSVNSSGAIAGGSSDPHGDFGYAGVWDDQGFHNLGDTEGRGSYALGINDGGWVVGSTLVAAGGSHGMLYRNGHMQDLGTLGISGAIYGDAYLINSSGLVVGSDQTGSGDNHQAFGWTWTDSTGMVQLPFSGEPPDLNDLGDMAAGKQIYNYYTHQFRNLSGATAIRYLNNVGDALGDGPNGVISLWVGQTRYNLQDLLPTGSGYTIDDVIDINDRGQILAVVIRNGNYDSALLNPVPEPASILALVSGFALLARRRPTHR